MPSIDFKEIAPAHTASGNQDSFELFARDFLTEILGLKILSEPNRGPDGGKDLIAEERQIGTLSESRTIWLVSCKHKAHSGDSVTPDDESNISDRMEQFYANGFIGFYSTLPSSGLNTRLDSYRNRYKINILDREKIESYIIGRKHHDLFKRYFPISYQKWFELEDRKVPSKILSEYSPLNCVVCGKDVLAPENKDHGIIGFVRNPKNLKTVHCYVACRGACDHTAERFHISRGEYTAWDDINDLMIPTIFLKRIIAVINQMFDGDLVFEKEGLEEYKTILISISQYVFRKQAQEEINRVNDLAQLPEGI